MPVTPIPVLGVPDEATQPAPEPRLLLHLRVERTLRRFRRPTTSPWAATSRSRPGRCTTATSRRPPAMSRSTMPPAARTTTWLVPTRRSFGAAVRAIATTLPPRLANSGDAGENWDTGDIGPPGPMPSSLIRCPKRGRTQQTSRSSGSSTRSIFGPSSGGSGTFPKVVPGATAGSTVAVTIENLPVKRTVDASLDTETGGSADRASSCGSGTMATRERSP